MDDQARSELDEFLASQLPAMTRLAQVLTLRTDAAEDLAQQTMLRLYQRWDQVRVAEHPGAYARRVMLNEFLTGSRRRRVIEVHGLPDAGRSDPGMQALEARETAFALLRQLPGRQRAAIALRYLEDRTDQEIAEILSCRRATVRSLVMRGLEKVRNSPGFDATREEAFR